MRKKTNPIWNLTKEQFQDLINTKNSVTEILSSIGASLKGNGSWRAFKLKAQLHNIDLTDFEKRRYEQRKLQSSNLSLPVDINSVLTENSIYNRHSLKKRLVNDGLLEYRCAICGNNGKWLEKDISLQLDHINGISNDNRIDNLRFLCPNCHSQTATFAGRSLKNNKDNKCGNCSNPISKNTKTGLCKKCSTAINGKLSAEKRRKVIRPSGQELESLVKKHGYSAVARMYGVSDNSVRKWLKVYWREGDVG